MTQPYKPCPHCQQPAELPADTCARCGWSFRTQFAAPSGQTQPVFPATFPVVPVLPMTPQQQMAAAYGAPPTPLYPQSLHCAHCQNAATVKLSGMVNSGHWGSNTIGVTVGAGHVFGSGANFGTVGVNNSNTRGANDLARKLAAPQPPAKRSPSGCMLGCGLPLAGMGLLGLLAQVSSGGATAFTFMLFGAALVAYYIYASNASAARYTLEHSRWQALMHAWEQLSYCSRCDFVFNPGTGQAAPSNAMYSLLQ